MSPTRVCGVRLGTCLARLCMMPMVHSLALRLLAWLCCLLADSADGGAAVLWSIRRALAVLSFDCRQSQIRHCRGRSW